MTPSDTPPDRRPPRPEPWDEDDRKIAERPAEGEWPGPAYYRLVGRRRPLGKPVGEAFPELEDGEFLELLDRVYETAEPATGVERTLPLVRGPDRPPEQVHVSLVDRPLVEDDGSTRGILMVARQVGIDVVAEGIETEARLDHLRKLGCDVGQGFLFARPMSPAAFVDLLRG